MRIVDLKKRYLRDSLAVRLGNLAANLTRIGNSTPTPEWWPFINRNIVESKYFIEWTASELPVQFWQPLIEIQVSLARLEREGTLSPGAVADQCAEAANWAETVISMMRCEDALSVRRHARNQ